MKAKGQSCGAALTAKSVEVGAAGSEGRSRLDHQRLTSAGKSAEMRIDAVLDRADAANAAAMGVDVTLQALAAGLATAAPDASRKIAATVPAASCDFFIRHRP